MTCEFTWNNRNFLSLSCAHNRLSFSLLSSGALVLVYTSSQSVSSSGNSHCLQSTDLMKANANTQFSKAFPVHDMEI